MNFFNNKKILSLLFLFNNSFCINYITNERGCQIGDAIANYCLAKSLSLKHPDKLKFLYTPFIHSDLFIFDSHETKIEPHMQFSETLGAYSNDNIVKYSYKDDVLFIANVETRVDEIDQSLVDIIKKEVQFKEIPKVNSIPDNMVTVAVHIRKGNGGGQFYDGEQSSLQIYDHNRGQISYLNDYVNFPFDWEAYKRNLNKIEYFSLANYKEYSSDELCGSNHKEKFLDNVNHWQTKFPPEQYYIDQIIKLSKELYNQNIYVQIFTDDRDPVALVERIKENVNLSNATFCYSNNRNFSFRDQVACDLYSMSRFDILIRSQSYFSRVAELMGNHKLIIYPLEYRWENNKLIMNTVVVKGDIQNLKRKIQ